MKKFVFILVLLTTSISFSQSHPIDKENRKCLENVTPATISTVKCEKEALVSWKKLMEKTLLQLKAAPKNTSANLLFDSQTHWLAFQKADLAFFAAFYRKQYEGGTMTMAAVATHEKRQFRQRTIYLLEFLEVLQEE